MPLLVPDQAVVVHVEGDEVRADLGGPRLEDHGVPATLPRNWTQVAAPRRTDLCVTSGVVWKLISVCSYFASGSSPRSSSSPASVRSSSPPSFLVHREPVSRKVGQQACQTLFSVQKVCDTLSERLCEL